MQVEELPGDTHGLCTRRRELQFVLRSRHHLYILPCAIISCSDHYFYTSKQQQQLLPFIPRSLSSMLCRTVAGCWCVSYTAADAFPGSDPPQIRHARMLELAHLGHARRQEERERCRACTGLTEMSFNGQTETLGGEMQRRYKHPKQVMISALFWHSLQRRQTSIIHCALDQTCSPS